MSTLSTNQSTAPGLPAGDARAVNDQPLWRRMIRGSATWVFLLDVVLVVGFATSDSVFVSSRNVQNIMLNGAEGLLLALAAAILLAAGLIDLSLGANLVFSSVMSAIAITLVAGGKPSILGGSGGTDQFTRVPLAVLVGVAVAVLAGMLFGLMNGLIITYLRVNSFIATLGTLSAGTGVVLLITHGTDIGNLPSGVQSGFGLYKVLGWVPLPALASLLVAVAIWAVIRYLKFGLHTLAIGSSVVAAERAGIRVRRHTVKLTLVAGGLAGLAGFMNLAHFGSTTINGHVNDPLAAITAAVIGGAAISGGRISVPGTVWGAALSLILLAGLVITGVSSFYQLIVIGAILILAVAVDQVRERKTKTS